MSKGGWDRQQRPTEMRVRRARRVRNERRPTGGAIRKVRSNAQETTILRAESLRCQDPKRQIQQTA